MFCEKIPYYLANQAGTPAGFQAPDNFHMLVQQKCLWATDKMQSIVGQATNSAKRDYLLNMASKPEIDIEIYLCRSVMIYEAMKMHL